MIFYLFLHFEFAMKNFRHIWFILCFIPCCLMGQGRVILSGYVRDSLSREALEGANIYLKEASSGCTSGSRGNFRITLDTGCFTLKVSFVGYRPFEQKIRLTGDQKINVWLSPVEIEGQTVTVTASRNDQNVEESQMGRTELHIESIKKMPAFFGETDVLKSIQLLPGIQSSGEGNSGFHVRGGSIDQNLILLDNVNIYNAGHLFGFFSVFNPDAVQTAEVMKGDIPANYGGRLSSVLNVVSPNGNEQYWTGNAGIGLIFSDLHIEGPLVKDKASLLLAGRRTYVDAVIQPFLRPTSYLKGLKFYFYDLNGKLSWSINRNNQLYLSAYKGSDTYGFRSPDAALDAQFHWDNTSAALNWWHFFNSQTELNTHFSITDYTFETDMRMEIYQIAVLSGIRDYSLRCDLDCHPSERQLLQVGGTYTYHLFDPNNYHALSGGVPMQFQERERLFAHDAAVYVLDRFSLGRHIKCNVGLRTSYFQQTGPYHAYVLNGFGQAVDTIFYAKGSKVKDYWGLEPRISFRYAIDSNRSVKAAYNHNYQYVQQVALSCISLPTDAWIPSSANILPQVCDQWAAGWFQDFLDHELTTSFEAYYKNMRNLTEYKAGFSPFNEATNGYANAYTQGKGWSYGFECLLQKNRGRLSGWLSYTLSWSFRQFEELNNGKTFCAKNDRRHDVSLMLSYEILPRLTTSIVWVYATGNTMTVPIGYYFVGYNLVVEYSETNAYRMPPYHRMDISVNWVFRRNERWEQSLNFSVYNVYNRRNPFFINIYTSLQGQDISKLSLETTAYQMSLFPILPSVSWNIRFK